MVSGGTDSTPDQKGVGITEAKKKNLFFARLLLHLC